MSDAPPILNQSFVKLARARKHITELESTIAFYLKDTPPRSSAFPIPGPNGEWIIYFHFSSNPIPAEFGAIVGDIIHNIRAALDFAACECVRRNNAHDKDVYFPFCEKISDLDDMIKRKHLNRAHVNVVNYVKSLAPHRGGNVALRAIHDLDVRDKHKALIPQMISFASPVLEMKDEFGLPRIPPRIVGDPNAPSGIKFTFPDDTDFAKEEVVPTLYKFVELAEDIINMLVEILNNIEKNTFSSKI